MDFLQKVIHDEFIELVGENRVFNTFSTRGGVAIGNKTYVTLIGSHFEGNTFVGGLKGSEYTDYTLRTHQIGLEYYTTVYVYEDIYIFSEDVEPFSAEFNKRKRLQRGTYGVYIGYRKKNNYVLFARKVR